MKPNRNSFASTPSQKSLTEATDNSHGDLSHGYFMPNQSQRRFTRKNNGSIEKKKNKTNIDMDFDSSISLSRNDQTPKRSKQKGLPSYLKINPELREPKNSQSHRQLNQVRAGSFTLQRARVTRLSNLQETIRISQQKNTSRQSVDSIGSRCAKSNNVAVLRTQLELKQKELMVLQDERRRFRNNIQELKRKQKTLIQQVNKSQAQARQIKQKFQQNIQELSKKLQQYEAYNRQLQKQNQKIKKQLVQIVKQKKIVQRQLNIFIQKQVPKNIRELQSCREISLQQIIGELKTQLNKNKSEVERQMQAMIEKLMVQSVTLRTEVKNLEIMNRLLDKKSVDSKRYLQAYTSIKGEYKSTRAALKQANQQCQLLRNQNVKMKKQIRKMNISMLGRSTVSRRISTQVIPDRSQQKSLSRIDSQVESLNLSLSNCSK